MAPKDYDIGEAELEVLKILWDEGRGTVRDVLNSLHQRGRRVAYTTVLTFLTRLEQKRYVKSDKSGLAYVYKPTVSREKVTRSRLRALVEQIYDGAAGPLALQLISSERFSKDEIDALHALIEKLDGKDVKEGKRKS